MPLSKLEISQRAAARKHYRKEGLLPKPKKPLNRKAFIVDAEQDAEQTLDDFEVLWYVKQAIQIIIAAGKARPTLETIGAAKALKMACELKRFEDRQRQEGRENASAEELFKKIQPILEA